MRWVTCILVSAAMLLASCSPSATATPVATVTPVPTVTLSPSPTPAPTPVPLHPVLQEFLQGVYDRVLPQYLSAAQMNAKFALGEPDIDGWQDLASTKAALLQMWPLEFGGEKHQGGISEYAAERAAETFYETLISAVNSAKAVTQSSPNQIVETLDRSASDMMRVAEAWEKVGGGAIGTPNWPKIGCPVLFAEACEGYLGTVGELLVEWNDASALAGVTARVALAEPLGHLQEIRRRTAVMEPPECAKLAHEYLLTHMNALIAAYLAFSGQADAEANAYFARANMTRHCLQVAYQ